MKWILYFMYFILFIYLIEIALPNSYSYAIDVKDPKHDDEILWQKISSIATIVAVVVSAIAVYFAAKEISRNRKVNEAQIYLSLRDLFSKHEEIQKNLHGGKWNERDLGPITDSNSGEELAKVESYLRFFEYCYVLIEDEIINPTTFKAMYESYINDLKNNYQIMQTVDEEGWIIFKKLLKRLENTKIPT
jgi:hypothetical protein